MLKVLHKGSCGVGNGTASAAGYRCRPVVSAAWSDGSLSCDIELRFILQERN